MSASENKALVHRFVEFFNQGNWEAVSELCAANFVNHDPAAPQARDHAGMIQNFQMIRAGFPDGHTTVEEIIAEGDRVATRWTFTGTHTGEWHGIPLTGKQVTLEGFDMYRISDGKIQEIWWSYNSLGVLQQLGAIPLGVLQQLGVIPVPERANENKAIVRRMTEEFYNQGNLELAEHFFADSYVFHDPASPQVRDRDGLKEVLRAFRAGCPDFHIRVDELWAEGDTVTKRWTYHATHTGDLAGIPPTGKRITMSGLELSGPATGKFVGGWLAYDNLSLLQQLGVIPVPELAGA